MSVVKKDAVGAIPPENNNTQLVNCSSFQQGDLVVSLDTGLRGQVLQPNFLGVPTQVFVRWGETNSSAVSALRLRFA